jgi:hypothetical protein
MTYVKELPNPSTAPTDQVRLLKSSNIHINEIKEPLSPVAAINYETYEIAWYAKPGGQPRPYWRKVAELARN